jgi:hypothetical protein
MLNAIRKELPGFNINKLSKNLYDIKRQKTDGQWLHVPAFIFNKSEIEGAVATIKETFRAYG